MLKCVIRETVCQVNVHAKKCHLGNYLSGKLSIWGTVHQGNISGELSARKMSAVEKSIRELSGYPWDYHENFGIYSQLDRKSKTFFFPELNGIKLWSHRFHFQHSGILQTRIYQRGDTMKMNFDNFKIKTWIYKQSQLKK